MAIFHLIMMDMDTKREVFREAMGESLWDVIMRMENNKEALEQKYQELSFHSFEGVEIRIRDIETNEDA